MKAISKNVYFDVLEDIVKKYSNTFHRTIKMKPIDVTSDSYVECNEDSNDKDIINSKLVIVSEYQKTKTFLLKDILKTGQKFLSLVKLKIQFRRLMLLVI